MAKFTKQAIMNCLLELLSTKQLDKITVKDICEICEINRNTFYYYFQDIYDVLDAVFQNEAEKSVRDVNEGASFYEEIVRCSQIVFANKKAIFHVYQSKKGDILKGYLSKIAEDCVGRYVEKEAAGYDLTESDKYYITLFYSHAIFGNTLEWIEKGLPPSRDDLMHRLSVSFQATIRDMIESCIKDQKSDK